MRFAWPHRQSAVMCMSCCSSSRRHAQMLLMWLMVLMMKLHSYVATNFSMHLQCVPQRVCPASYPNPTSRG